MSSAYYKEKIPKYERDIASGKRKMVTFYESHMALVHDMEMFNCDTVIAHNARFDYNVTNSTQRYLTKSKYRYYLPYGTNVWDSMKMANDTIAKQKMFIKFCEENGFMTNHKTPRPRVTAEVLYRFFTQDTEYSEEHTALEDVLIEKEIVVRCFRTHKKMRKGLWGD